MNKIEISVAFIAGILGIAYPILLEVVSRLDEKYSSLVVVDLFRKEKRRKFFRIALVAGLIALLIYVAGFPPPDKKYTLGIDLENSAEWLVAGLTIILIIVFFQFINIVLIYYTPTRFFSYLEKRHVTDPSRNNYEYFKAMSDLLYSSVKQQNETIALTVTEFMSRAFMAIRDEQHSSEVVYPRAYYDMVYRLIEDVANNKNHRLRFLEQLSSSGTWFFGGSGGKISEVTYGWLWNNILLALNYERDDFILHHWEHAYQYKQLQLRYISEEHGDGPEFEVLNKLEIQERNADRHRFMEFHYMLGTLLLSQGRYKCLKRAYDFTQSIPPQYELLPQTMDEIFHWYFEFNDTWGMNHLDLEYKYRFPELSGLHSGDAIRGWISQYMALLFLRQYAVGSYYYGMEPLSQPQLPAKQYEKKQWMDNLPYFKRSLQRVLNNTSLLETLGYDAITDEWCRRTNKPTPLALIDKIIESVSNSFDHTQETQEVSAAKYQRYVSASQSIIKPVLDQYEKIRNKQSITGTIEKRFVNGLYYIMDKSAFAEDQEADHGNYDTFLAQSFVTKFTNAISEIFAMAGARRYMFELEYIGEAVKRLNIDPANYSFVTFGLDQKDMIPILSASGITNPNLIQFNRHNHHLGNSLFVIKTNDLPVFLYREQTAENRKLYGYEKIIEEYNLYATVADLYQMPDLKASLEANEKEKDLNKSVYVAIAVRLELQWRKEAQWIEFRIASPYRRQGVLNKLQDVQSLIDSDKNNGATGNTAAQ